MRPEAESLLHDAVSAGRNAQEFVRGVSFEDFLTDAMRRAAVERALYIVGEAIAQLRVRDRATFDRLTDASKIIGLRNLLAHGYSRVDDARLWRDLNNSLPDTLAEIERLLADAEE